MKILAKDVFGFRRISCQSGKYHLFLDSFIYFKYYYSFHSWFKTFEFMWSLSLTFGLIGFDNHLV